MNGKGSKPRPLSVPVKDFDRSFDAIFRKTPESEKPKDDEPRK